MGVGSKTKFTWPMAQSATLRLPAIYPRSSGEGAGCAKPAQSSVSDQMANHPRRYSAPPGLIVLV